MPIALATSSAGGNATITLAADAGKNYTIDKLAFSYNGVPVLGSIGTLTVKRDSTTIFNIDIVGGAFGMLEYQFAGDGTNVAMEVKLTGVSLGLIGLVGKLWIEYRES